MKSWKMAPIYGEIPGFDGVYANEPTVEECQRELQGVLEDWILLGLRLGHELPVIDNLNLNVAGKIA